MKFDKQKQIIIIAGPNGAGKTTIAMKYLFKEDTCLKFINADVIASGLNHLDPGNEAFAAGRAMIRQIQESVEKGESFAFETTLSGLNYARWIPKWRKDGYYIALIFLWLPSPDIAVARVEKRVKAGGHNIPEATIRRRYTRGYNNFLHTYSKLVDEWMLFDSSDGSAKIKF